MYRAKQGMSSVDLITMFGHLDPDPQTFYIIFEYMIFEPTVGIRTRILFFA